MGGVGMMEMCKSTKSFCLLLHLVNQEQRSFSVLNIEELLVESEENIHTLESILQEQPAGCARLSEAFNYWTGSN